jgi:hypothetical protein
MSAHACGGYRHEALLNVCFDDPDFWLQIRSFPDGGAVRVHKRLR